MSRTSPHGTTSLHPHHRCVGGGGRRDLAARATGREQRRHAGTPPSPLHRQLELEMERGKIKVCLVRARIACRGVAPCRQLPHPPLVRQGGVAHRCGRRGGFRQSRATDQPCPPMPVVVVHEPAPDRGQVHPRGQKRVGRLLVPGSEPGRHRYHQRQGGKRCVFRG